MGLPKGRIALRRDPRVYRAELPAKRDRKRFLGLDLASSCGVAFADIVPGEPAADAAILVGQWDLSLSQHDTNSLRYVRLKHFLSVTEPDLIAYEEVKFTGGRDPHDFRRRDLAAMVARAVSGAQVVQSLAAVLLLWAEENDIPCQAVPVGTLKKYATGKGNANKLDMIRAANARFGFELPEDYQSTGSDNIADAAFLCALAVESYVDGV